jgi:hypothetical protein
VYTPNGEKNYFLQFGRSKVELKHKMLTTPLASDIQVVLHYKARPSADLTFLLFNLNRHNKIYYQAGDSKMTEYERGCTLAVDAVG